MINVLIVDDEQLARMRLRRLIDDFDNYQVVGEAENGQQAIDMARSLRPDLILMDIRMPGVDGMQAAKEISEFEPAPAILFCTAYDQYALEAFDRHALGYLLKPVKRAALEQAMEHATRLNKAQLTVMEQEEQGGSKHIAAKTHRGVELIPIENIRFFMADHKYVTVYHTDGQTLIDDTLKELEERLGHNFIRVHRNALVQVSSITGLERDSEGQACLVMRDIEDKPMVSRRHVSEIKALLTTL